MDVTIRQALESDAEAISSLVTGWAHYYVEDPTLPEAEQFLASLTTPATAERIRSDNFKYYVAVDGSVVRGVIAIRDDFHLYHLFVRADSHGKGVARALWEHAKSLSESTTFVVNSSLPAVAVYQRFGFVVKDVPQSASGLTFVPMEYSRAADDSFEPKDATPSHGDAGRRRSQTMYILYHFPYSQHARRVVSLMVEANLEYELRHVAMDKGEHRSAEYLAINPNHQVPTLVDGDVRIHESNAILRYLCVKHGLTVWYPEEPKARAKVEQWLDWNQCRLSPTVVDIVLNSVFLGPSGDRAAVERGLSRLPELWSILDAGLVDTAFVAGSRPTIADLSLASSVFQLTFASIAPVGRNTTDWFQRVSELEGFRKSLPRKG